MVRVLNYGIKIGEDIFFYSDVEKKTYLFQKILCQFQKYKLLCSTLIMYYIRYVISLTANEKHNVLADYALKLHCTATTVDTPKAVYFVFHFSRS